MRLYFKTKTWVFNVKISLDWIEYGQRRASQLW